ncbi:MAG: NFACT family protein, partial [Acidaminococcaceae bacterium]|nr:NFACT family protein [Acidaminococcaceae bacterium]
MNIEAIDLYKQTKYLQQELAGVQIQRIFMPTPQSVLFECRGKKNIRLLADLGGNGPALYIHEGVLPTPAEPPGFCMLLRKHFEDGYIERVEQLNFDRIIILKINAPIPGDKYTPKELVFELTGRNSNIILLENNRIINCLKHIGPAINRTRSILPGLDYVPPEQTKTKLHPLAVEAKILAAVIGNKPGETLADKILASLQGIGKRTAQRLAEAADLQQALLDLQQQCSAPADDQTNKLIQEKMAAKPLQLDQQKQLLGMVRNEVKRLAKKLALQQQDLQQAENAEEYRQKADTLMANLGSIDKGAKSCTLDNIYDGAPLQIDLNAALTPNDNAQNYYKKYAKLKRAKTEIAKQIAATQEEARYLGEIENSLTLVLTREEVEEIKQELQNSGYIRKPKGKKAPQPLSQPLKIQLADGIIYIGKNNRQNDLVTFRYAKANDLWFHTKDIPGSHVVLIGEQ